MLMHKNTHKNDMQRDHEVTCESKLNKEPTILQYLVFHSIFTIPHGVIQREVFFVKAFFKFQRCRKLLPWSWRRQGGGPRMVT